MISLKNLLQFSHNFCEIINIQLSRKQSMPNDKCPGDKYWVRPHQRIKKTKSGKIYIEHVEGYCSSYRAPYPKIALEEKISLDHLYFALAVYGEARSQNTASIRKPSVPVLSSIFL